MNRKSKLALIATSAIVAAGVVAGAAFAASDSATPAPAPAATDSAQATRAPFDLDQAVQAGKITQAEADLLKQLHEQRQAAMAKLQADAKATIDQAVQAGKITQGQANKLLAKGHGMMMERGGKFMGKGGPMGMPQLSQEELKAKLDEAVKAGKLTQAEADKILSGEAPARIFKFHVQGKGRLPLTAPDQSTDTGSN